MCNTGCIVSICVCIFACVCIIVGISFFTPLHLGNKRKKQVRRYVWIPWQYEEDGGKFRTVVEPSPSLGLVSGLVFC